jgi:glycosyltransferase involved in cell wall biosynthesis
MFGWEFPPFHAGGLGVVCKDIVEGLSRHQVRVHLVLPKIPIPLTSSISIHDASLVKKVDIIDGVRIEKVDTLLHPYITQEGYQVLHEAFAREHHFSTSQGNTMYGKDLFHEVEQYAKKAGSFAKKLGHDVIHAHDWMTYKAALEAKKVSGKPFVAHVHATEGDRTGENPHPTIAAIEREGLLGADKVIAVSEYTKQKLIEYYGIPAEKIEVVHNAVDHLPKVFSSLPTLSKKDKIVTFLGRITMQKGPEYFIRAAAKTLTKVKNVKFVVAGTGDMLPFLMEESARLNIARNVLFAGWLSGEDIDRAYQMADLYVMPSVSEPFGVTALESIKNGTPVLISKQSGVSEVLPHALKVDFWDVDEMANKMIASLRYPSLLETVLTFSHRDMLRYDWKKQTEKIKTIYQNLLSPKK